MKRPYVAAWVEDADGFPVKTLLLWVQKDGPGPRWIPDLKRWHRADRLRKLAEDSDLVQTISEATRQPGSHAVTWDGTDNGGLPLPPGDYVLCLEAAREHGKTVRVVTVPMGHHQMNESPEETLQALREFLR